jgi:hypothetical protein
MMSTGTKMPYSRAKALAERIAEILAPSCQTVAVAGSIRRQEREAKG